MNRFAPRTLFPILMLSLAVAPGLLTGCGGSNNSSSINPNLIGGNIMGTGLSLTGTPSTLAGTKNVYAEKDGTGTAAEFDNPAGIATDGTNLYVVDAAGATLRKVVISTGVVTTLADSSNGLYSPTSVTTDGTNLYITDSDSGEIFKYGIASNTFSTFTTVSSGISGITTDGTNLYVVNDSLCLISKIPISTATASAYSGTVCTSSASAETGTQTLASASYYEPWGITTDGKNLYVTEIGGQVVRQINLTSGAVTILAGTFGTGGHTDATGTAAAFYQPWGISTDGVNLYIGDISNGDIRKIVISTGVVTTLVNSASSPGEIYGLANTATGLYGADYGYSRVVAVQ